MRAETGIDGIVLVAEPNYITALFHAFKGSGMNPVVSNDGCQIFIPKGEENKCWEVTRTLATASVEARIALVNRVVQVDERFMERPSFHVSDIQDVKL